jgi:hypothetical protein
MLSPFSFPTDAWLKREIIESMNRPRRRVGFRGLTFCLALSVSIGCSENPDTPLPEDLPDTSSPALEDIDEAVDSDLTDSGEDTTHPLPDGTVDTSEDSMADGGGLDDTFDGETLEEEDGETDDVSSNDTADAGDDSEQRPPCSPPLVISPVESWLLPLEAIDFQTSGGTGTYEYAYLTPPIGSLLNPFSGRYLAARDGGGVDKIVVTDAFCEGSAVATVHVVTPLDIAPRRVEIEPLGGFALDISEGSGQYRWTLLPDGAGGSLDGARYYRAPASEGRDRIEVEDLLTLEKVVVEVSIVSDARPRLSPPAAFIPVGSTMTLSIEGGSGHYDIDADGTIALADGLWTASTDGNSELQVNDRFTGLASRGLAISLAPLEQDIRPSQPSSSTGAMVSADVDGDGFAELVASVAEVTVDRGQSGAVYIYRGLPDGLAKTPVQILSGRSRSENYGRALAVADLSDDGIVDLLIGISAADGPGSLDRGQVDVHLGRPDGTFEPAPARTFSGDRTGDNFGTALAVCDFDGDGDLDIAVGAPSAEDTTVTPAVTSQGLVDIRLKDGEGLDGFASIPSQVLFGLVPGSPPHALTNFRSGSVLAAGDLNGDGLCDLAIGAQDDDLDGAVIVHRGVLGEGLAERPSRTWSGLAQGITGSRFGFSLAIGDLDGDGVEDLVVGQRNWSTVAPPASNNAAGATRIIRGGSWVDTTDTARSFTALEVDWSATGAASDNHGHAVAIGEATGDDLPDLLIGVLADELASPAPTGTGSVQVHAGIPAALPLTARTARYGGELLNDRCALAVTALPRTTGPDDLAAICLTSDISGPDVGSPILHRIGAPPTLLEMPVNPSPWRTGQSITPLPDLDGDGFDELAVGSPDETLLTSTASHSSFAGMVRIYRGTRTGFTSENPTLVSGFTGHSASDRLGYGLTSGDIDGDRDTDLIALARFEDRPSTYAAATYANTDCPATAASDSGAAYVFTKHNNTLSPQPTHIVFSDQAGQGTERVLTADVDGDGDDDLILAATQWDRTGRTNAGGFQIFRSEPPVPGKIVVSCSPDLEWYGRGPNDLAGSAAARLGDLDGDGCEDFAIGAPLDDLAAADSGAVYLILGAGPRCASPTHRAAVLPGPAANEAIGDALDAADIDDDGLVELLVGSSRHRKNGVAVGGVWLVPGRHLRSVALTATAFSDGNAPSATGPLLPAETSDRLFLEGKLTNERFGATVGLVPALGPAGHPTLMAASPAGDRTGILGVSTFVMHELRFGPDTPLHIVPSPLAVFAGETPYPNAYTSGSWAYANQAGVGVIALGMPDSNALARDFGAVYTTRVDILESILPEAPSLEDTPCDPPLALSPLDVSVGPRGAVDFSASGGNGGYVFELVSSPSGGSIDPGLGLYIAGDAVGVDTVRLTSRGCIGSAEATINVLSKLVARPTALAIPPLGSFEPELTGGSNRYRLSVSPNPSGATILGTRYRAGANEGDDTLVVTDTVTLATTTIAVKVRRNAGPELGPDVVYVPESHTFSGAPSGGSGEYDIAISGTDDNISREGNTWSVEGEGAAELTLTDRWTGVVDTQSVRTLGTLDHALLRSTPASFQPSVAIADLNGDTYTDAVIALPDTTIDRGSSGAVWVFLGTSNGLETTPVQTFSGQTENETLGRGLALADVDGDDKEDLVLGAPRADTPSLVDNGAVFVHRGLGNGRFETAPFLTLRGAKAGDLYGVQVAACDLDMDGFTDLVVGAPNAEEASASSQGGLVVHLGSATGLSPTPSFTRWGLAPNGTTWVPTSNLQLGLLVATGDLDDDGACDVVSASNTALSNAGAVFVYRGQPRATSATALSQTPVRAWTGEYAGGTASRLGSALGIGDLDGDAKDDLLIGQRAWSTVASANNNFGAVRMQRGGDWLLTPETAWRSPTEFDWSAFGSASSDQFGYWVAVGDATGDGLADAIIGANLDEVAGGQSNAGVVHVHPGVTANLPAAASRIIAGPNLNDRLGTLVASLSLPGQTGTAILAMSQFSDENGPDIGGAHVLSRGATETRVDLSLPHGFSPWRIGHAVVTLPDMNGDGRPELAVGTPDELTLAPTGADHRPFSGTVSLYRGTDSLTTNGFSSAPFQRLLNFPGHSGYDRFGDDIAPIGDFDGDGRGDLAVATRSEDRPSSYSATYQNVDCPIAPTANAAISNNGAIYIFSGDGAGGFHPTPTFVLFGPQAEQGLGQVIGPGDLNKDGKADLIVSTDTLDDTGKSNTGGIQVWFGRSATASKITAICTPALTFLGRNASDTLGTSATPLGDLDHDGCQDAAIAAPLYGGNDTGAIYLLLGAGPNCASTSFRTVALTGPSSNARIGQSLSAADLDDDGLMELAVGSTNTHTLTSGTAYGAVWLIEGTRLETLAALAVPLASPEVTAPLFLDADAARLRLVGGTLNERFGLPLALIPSVGPSGRAAIAIGSGAGSHSGTPGVSTVLIYQVATIPDLALSPAPIAVLAGETRFPDVLGSGAFAVAAQGLHTVLAMGLEGSSALSPDVGAVFVAPLTLVDDALSEAP